MKRTFEIKYSLFLLVSLISVYSCNKASKDGAGNYSMTVNVEEPMVDSVMLHKTYPGYLTANSEVEIVARVNGDLQSIDYTAGQYVKKGQLLFVIEPAPYKDALAQSKAELSSAISQNDYAKNNYMSMKEAIANNAVSKIDFIQAQSAWNQSIAAIESAKAAVETAKLNLSYCYIRAPFSGHITKSSPNVGDYLNGSASPQTLATIYDDKVMNAYFTIEDNQYIKMLSRQKQSGKNAYNTVNLSFESMLPHNYSGKIDYLSPNVDLSTGTMTLRAKVQNPYSELRSGMYCIISLPYEQLDKALLIKDAAISTDQLGKYIFLVNDSDKIVYNPVEVGDLVNDSLRIITKGIKPGQKYVSEALQKVRDGMKVKPNLSKN